MKLLKGGPLKLSKLRNWVGFEKRGPVDKTRLGGLDKHGLVDQTRLGGFDKHGLLECPARLALAAGNATWLDQLARFALEWLEWPA